MDDLSFYKMDVPMEFEMTPNFGWDKALAFLREEMPGRWSRLVVVKYENITLEKPVEVIYDQIMSLTKSNDVGTNLSCCINDMLVLLRMKQRIFLKL